MKRKRVNKLDMEHILVGAGDQVLATGNKVNATTALGITNNQLGVLSLQHGATRPYGEFLQAGDVITDVSEVALVQGTPKSAAIQTVDPWEVSHKGTMETSKIRAGYIRSVTTKTCTVPVYSTEYFSAFAPVLNEQDYLFQSTLDSVRRDRDYGDNDELATATFVTPDYTALPAILDSLDHLLQNLLYQVNNYSTLSATSNYGRKPILALGLNSAGGTGVAVGTITNGTTIPVQTNAIGTTTVIADFTLVNTINKAIAAGLPVGATVELIDLSVAGTIAGGAGTATIDSFLNVGLDDEKATAFDNIKFTKVRVKTTLGDGFLLDPLPTRLETSFAENGSGKGSDWTVENDNRARLNIHTMQNSPSEEFFNQGITYVNPAIDYTSTIIDYYDWEETMTVTPQVPKQAVLLLECQISNPAADAATGYTVATVDTATVASLNAVFGAWLTSEKTVSNHEILGDATPGVYFV